MKNHILITLGAGLALLAGNIVAAPMGTAFTYQGRLVVSSNAANGSFDIEMRLYDALAAGGQVAGPTTNAAVAVSNGLFTVNVDLGGAAFDGNARWLGISVRTNGGGAFTALTPRQELKPVPYALFASNAAVAVTAGTVVVGGVGTAGLQTGAVDSTKILDGTIVSNDLSPALLNNTFWRLNGNTGTTTNNFLGTTDNQSLSLKVNGITALQILPGGGSGNLAPTIVAGAGNQSSPGQFNRGCVISGGSGNIVLGTAFPAENSVISGGLGNTNAGIYNSIGGGNLNVLLDYAQGSTISGGQGNTMLAYATYCVIGGGSGNSIQGRDGSYCTIGGGINNFIEDHLALGVSSATIGGGSGNQVNTGSTGAVIGGGVGNSIIHYVVDGTIGGGSSNTITGDYGTIPGGDQNIADINSLAAGHRAKATNTGTFVWADSTDADFSTTRSNQFLIRATGGVGINTASTIESSLCINTNAYLFSHALYLRGETAVDHNHGLAYSGGAITNFGNGNVQVDGPVLWGYAGGALGMANPTNRAVLTWNGGGILVNGGATITGGSGANQTVSWAPGNASWSFSSDRNLKENFSPVDAARVLEKVAQLPVQQWNYKGYAAQHHIGPMAQDFHALFPLNDNDKMLQDADLHGVALAAIQGLNEKVEAGSQRSEVRSQLLAEKLQEKDAKISGLEARVGQLERLVNQLAEKTTR